MPLDPRRGRERRRAAGARARRRDHARALGRGARHRRRRRRSRPSPRRSGWTPRRSPPGPPRPRSPPAYEADDAGSDRPPGLRRADVRLPGRAVLGTGPARLPGPQTGTIACLPDGARSPGRRPGDRARQHAKYAPDARSGPATGPSRRFPLAVGHLRVRENRNVTRPHLRARLRDRSPSSTASCRSTGS